MTAHSRYCTVTDENRAENEQGRWYVLITPELPSASRTVLGSPSEKGQRKMPFNFPLEEPAHRTVEASAKMYRSVKAPISSPMILPAASVSALSCLRDAGTHGDCDGLDRCFIREVELDGTGDSLALEDKRQRLRRARLAEDIQPRP